MFAPQRFQLPFKDMVGIPMLLLALSAKDSNVLQLL